MSKNYQTSVNPCGRRINYPRFGALDERQQKLVTNRAQQAQSGQSLQALVPPPGVDVEESPCRDYYISRDISKLDDNCMNCIYQTWNNDMNCPCQLNPDKPCEYAKCVFEKYNTNQSCAEPFFAMFNVDDVQDEAYRPPFSLGDIKNCGVTGSVTTTPNGSTTPKEIAAAEAASSRTVNASRALGFKNSLIVLAVLIGLGILVIAIMKIGEYMQKRKKSKSK